MCSQISIKVQKGAIFLFKELRLKKKSCTCVSMCMHKQRIKVILSMLTGNHISGFRHVYSAMLWNSRVRSVLSMTLSSWKYKCYTGREQHTLDAEECWREILSSSNGLVALFFLKANQSRLSVITVLQALCLAPTRNALQSLGKGQSCSTTPSLTHFLA